MILSTIGLLAISMPAKGQNNLIPEFTVDGTTKEYRDTSSNGTVIHATQTSSVSRNGDNFDANIQQTFQNRDASQTFFIEVNNQGVFDNGYILTTSQNGNTTEVHKQVNESLLEEELVVPLGQDQRDTGDYDLNTIVNGQTVQSTDLDVTQTTNFQPGFESVTVPAGTFSNAIRVEVTEVFENTTSAGGQTTTSTVNSTHWLVNGVGLVKSITNETDSTGDSSSSTLVLLSYTVPGNVPTGQPSFTNNGSSLPLLSEGGTPANPKAQLAAIFDVNGVSDAGNGYCYSAWLGFFYGESHPWIYHITLGWLYLNSVSSESSGEFYFYDQQLGWIFTSEVVYPSLYSYDREEWLYYVEDSDPRVILVTATGQPI